MGLVIDDAIIKELAQRQWNSPPNFSSDCEKAKAERLGMPVEEFLKKIRNKVVYLHLHNNGGEDNHQGLDEGNLDWRSILDQLDMKKVGKIISEVHDYQKMAGEVKLVEGYLGRKIKTNILPIG